MKRIVLVYGLIIGAIITGMMLYMVSLIMAGKDFKTHDILGYAAMIIVFSLIFVGVRSYRNNILGGVISFGKAFKTGVLIALVASTLYVVTWLIYYYGFVPDFMDKYIPFALEQAAEKGASPEEIEKKNAQMVQFKEMYQNPLFVILLTYMEMFPIGLIVALISALILKKK